MLLTLALFAFWAAVGSATLWLLERRLPALRMALIAPAVGIVLHTLCLFLLNFAGVPIRYAAWPVTIVLLAASAVVIWRTRPAVPWRRLRGFAWPLAAALLLVGGPMLKFGQDWVSYCNDDMANYCLGAQRLMDVGFYRQPTDAALLEGTDYPQLLWFLHVPANYRPGSEQVLAHVATVTRLMPVEIYMSVVLAFHLAMIAAAGGLVAWKDDLKPAAVATCWLIAASALAALGSLYQLIAQVCGLALLSAGATLAMRVPEPGRGWRRDALLLGIFGAGVLVIYPEISPFLALAYVVYVGVAVARGRASLRPVAKVAGVAAVVALALTNVHAVPTVGFLLQQVAGGAGSEVPQLTLFPYYLMPSGLANLWGIQSLAAPLPLDPWGSILIAAGFALTLCAAAAAVRLAWRGHPVGAVACVMLVTGAVLFRKGSGFGLFKLAMYAQPFLLGAVAVAWWRLSPGAGGRPLRVVPLALLAAAGLHVQRQYVKASEGTGKGFNELVDASRSRVFDQARAAVAAPPPAVFVSDAYNITAAKFQMMNARGKPAAFPSNRFMPPAGNFAARYKGFGAAAVDDANQRLLAEYTSQFPTGSFRLDGTEHPVDPDHPPTYTRFYLDTLAGRLTTGDELLVATTGRQSPFNRRHTGYAPPENFLARPVAQARNHLVFVASDRGQPYFFNGTDPRIFALYQLETDAIFFPQRSMAGVGRYLLFRVINPTERLRLVFELTSSYRGDGENALPAIDAIGRRRVPFVSEPGDPTRRGPSGRGAARLVSPPIEPQMIQGQPYVCVDLGEFGKMFPAVRQGLMKLWGTDVAMDRRRLVAFCRDLSAVSEEEYAAFRPPSALQHFGVLGARNDLGRGDLEFTGFYEDGWLPETAEAVLYEPEGARVLNVRGVVPEIEGSPKTFTTDVVVLLDGVEVARRASGLGDFDLKVPLPPAGGDGTLTAGGRRRVGLRFTNTQRLPGFDRRPVACKLHYIGFETPPSAPSRIETFPQDVSDPDLKFTGLAIDGWLPKRSMVKMTQLADHGYLVLKGMVPRIDDESFRTEVVLSMDGREVARKQVGLDAFELRAPVPPQPGYRTIEVTFSNVQTLPGNDGRSVGALMRLLAFEPGEASGE